MGARRYTDQQLRDAVADPEVRTIADLCRRRLGIVPPGGNYETIRTRAATLGVTVGASGHARLRRAIEQHDLPADHLSANGNRRARSRSCSWRTGWSRVSGSGSCGKA